MKSSSTIEKNKKATQIPSVSSGSYVLRCEVLGLSLRAVPGSRILESFRGYINTLKFTKHVYMYIYSYFFSFTHLFVLIYRA